MSFFGKLFDAGVTGYLASKAAQGYIFGTQLRELSATLNHSQLERVRLYAEKHELMPREAMQALLTQYGFIPN